VVILYEHALLGEGIAKYLLAQLGVEARPFVAQPRRGYKGSCKSYATAHGDAVTRRYITRTAHVSISETMTGQPTVSSPTEVQAREGEPTPVRLQLTLFIS